MRTYSIITLFILFIFSCNQNNINKTSNKVIKKEAISKTEALKSNSMSFDKKKCPCIMSEREGRYAFISYKDALTDNQKKLVIKLCENSNNNFALSVESWAKFDENGKPKRGKIYDYKVLDINDNYVAFTDDGCKLKNTGEHLYMIQLSKGIHSIWRISKGKLIELDKKKEYPCIDYEEMPYE